jgi:hypothetical protein
MSADFVVVNRTRVSLRNRSRLVAKFDHVDNESNAAGP